MRQQQEQWQKLYLATLDLNEDELRAALRSRKASRRFVAAYVVGDRRLMWTKELITRLTDRVPAVRQAARRSLVILSFLALNPEEAALIASPTPSRPLKPLSALVQAVDFGPLPQANRKAQKTAAKKWTAWWAERQDSTVMVSKTLVNNDDTLAKSLLRAKGPEREKLIRQYRELKGRKYTEALAAAAERLNGNERRKLREALAARMARMSDGTLRGYLEDDSAEIRRAAVLGVAMRASMAHLSRMIDMLEDPDPAVVVAVVAALRSLSGKEYGPELNATQEEHKKAVNQWRQWAKSMVASGAR
jgi:hypothetical protein